MQRFDILALTPPGSHDPAVAIAASRAGARGILDLEYTEDLAQAAPAIEQLRRFAKHPYGVKLGRGGQALLEHLLSEPAKYLRWVVLAGGEHEHLAGWVEQLHARQIAVLLEATSVAEMQRGHELGVDGLVLKGNESGGRIGGETAFILLQRHNERFRDHRDSMEIWVQGGIGRNTAAACYVAGASGIVLDAQLLLSRESRLSPHDKSRLGAFDGSETLELGASLGESYRVYNRPKCSHVAALQAEETRLETSELSNPEKIAAWREAIRRQTVGAGSPDLLLLGQDAALAKDLCDAFVTVGGIVEAIRSQVQTSVASARRLLPLAEGAPMAVSHGTRYPLLQGPMTRVSDTAAFADSVAAAGALPFLALALLRRNDVARLLKETSERLADRPWGVGLLGFLPAEIRNEQIAAILENKPPLALIAGGRPDQAAELESEGIPTYLHVPSPGLLKMFLKDGARRFVFEGRECGGHVGPRSSFLLWETMCQILLDHLGPSGKGDPLHVVFAGGIHDSLSGAMVAALAAPLAERGVKIGALMGTAYLFTQEAVEAGAIVPRFQQEAVQCDNTVLMTTGPGHAIRCIKTPYFDVFEAEKQRLKKEGKSHEEIVKALEWMNIGRLRVASKGLDRVADGGVSKIEQVADDVQYDRGMYMIGQVAAMHRGVVSMAELHADVCGGGAERLTALQPIAESKEIEAKPCDIAIIGMASHYPDSINLTQYWENILNSHYAVTEIPASHWDWRPFYDPDPRAKDKIVSKWGGFVGDIVFDPLRYGITPKSMMSIEPLQLLVLESVRKALDDAGYTHRPFNREKTCAILGIGGGGSPMAVGYGFRACLPMLDSVEAMPAKSDQLLKIVDHVLPEWTEDSFPGFLMNVAVGRVANRFNFGGSNYAIDAACASSLAALHACVRELEMGTADVAVAMGADTVQTPYAYMAFSKTHALSHRGKCSPFDAAADGIVLSEGVGVVILKRLADAERDGDRIYGVIRGVGSSSDGKEKGLTAPNASGQLRAITRAYSKAGLSPSHVELVEAHGTGTVVGDQTEVAALQQVMREAGAPLRSCAIGSVKSMIGHSKCAAGIAGLIKTTMALHTKVLPPTLVETPNPKAKFDESALYLNTSPRPWIHGAEYPRLAGVSAFGFGGTNEHVVMEEYTGEFLNESPPARRHWPAELMVWRRASREAVLADVEKVLTALQAGAKPDLAELSASLWKASGDDASQPTLAVVASSLEDLRDKLASAVEALRVGESRHEDPRGVFFAESPREQGGKVALLFPGQGSQYPDMLAETAMAFPSVRAAMDTAERVLRDKLTRPLGRYIYPPSPFGAEQEKWNQQQLAQTDVAQPAIGAASIGMLHLLRELGLSGDFAAGHSYGEYAALCAAGVMSEEDLYRLSHRRGEVIAEASADNRGTMAAVEADAATVEQTLTGVEGVTIANINAPKQTVISGSEQGVEAALAALKTAGLRGRRIPVSCAFHSPLVADAGLALAESLKTYDFQPPRIPVYSNTTADEYPHDAQSICGLLAEHLKSSVRFQDEIEAMYAAGARVFVEVGPHAVLTGLVKQILGDRPFAAVSSDSKSRSGLVQLAHLLGHLLTCGVGVRLDQLFVARGIPTFDLASIQKQTGEVEYGKNIWVVNGIRSRPLNSPEPVLLGQAAIAGKSTADAPEKPKTKTAASATTRSATAASVAPASKPAAATAAPTTSHTGNGVAPALPPTPHVVMPQSTPTSPATSETTNGHASNGAAQHYAAAPGDEATQVMMRFQDVMSRFLETQQAVMMGYLHGAAASPTPIRQMAAHAPAGLPAPAPTYPAAHEPNGHAGATDYADANGHAQGSPAMENGAAHTAAASNGHAAANGQPAVAAGDASHGAGHNGAVENAAAENGAVSEQTAEAGDGLAFDRADVEKQLLDLVSERTGYPHDMLDVDLDLEGDLGIDSIKRVEILGNLAEIIGLSTDPEAEADSNIEFEKLTAIKTLRGILDYLEEALSEAPAAGEKNTAEPSANGHASHAETNGHAEGEVAIQRGLVELCDAPLPKGGSLTIPSGAVLLTDDGRGIAADLAGRLADFGQQTVFLRMPVEGQQDGDGVFYADLTDPQAVSDVLSRVRQQVGTLGGLVHLAPLAEANPQESAALRMQREVKSLYLLARELETELRSANGSVLLAPTALGGSLGFGEEPLPDSYFAGQGGIVGFIKCLGMEWPEVLVRVVDFDGGLAAGEVVDRLLGELSDAEGPLEVGYAGSRRVTWKPVAGAMTPDESRPPVIEKGATILITGGARGITSAIALELSRNYQPNLVLVGRSPLPEESEAAETASLTDPADIKKALIARMQREGRPPAPAAIETTFQRLMRDREIRDSIDQMRQAGASVEYHQLDVRDEAGMTRLLDDLKRRFGGIDGVIHGAGVIEDKLVKDKTPESFDRVFGTKTDSAMILAEHLDPQRLKFLVFFASIASRYGNRGQSDYAAANEVLSKLAWQLDRKWPCRVVSIAWGPWSGLGMVSDLEKHLTARGLKLISPTEGPQFLLDEINHGAKGQSEVMVAGGAENVVTPLRTGQGQKAAV
ncbi:MAG: SDR family NAD(P)-dependent oxidoreductase [Pirellulaceae bacterium]